MIFEKKKKRVFAAAIIYREADCRGCFSLIKVLGNIMSYFELVVIMLL